MTPAPKLADMEPVLAQVASWDNSQSHDPLYEFSNFLQAAIASKAELPQIEARLLRMLAPQANTTPAARDYVCRQLSLIGTGASVGVLARLLAGRATADMARYTLARIPDPAAAAALRDALPKTSGALQAGIVNALGERRDAKAVPALKGLTGSSDAAVSGAALSALALIGNAQALAAIQAALPNAGSRRERVLGAYIRCAGAVLAGGDTAAASSVYRQLSAASEPDTVRIAALDGLASVDAIAAIPALSKELGSANAVIQAAAIRLLNRIPGAGVTTLFVTQYGGLKPTGQIRVLSALADRGDAAARPAVTDAVSSAEPEIRTAALGKVGDASSVPVLAGAAANAPSAEQAAARESLAMLRGAGVDAAIAAAIASSAGKVRLELIRAAGGRASAESADVLMKAAQGTDTKTALAAIRALRNAAGPEQAAALLDAVMKIANASQRREAALTLASVIKRARQTAIGPVLAAWHSAADKQIRLTLLGVMGEVSAEGALPVLRAGLKDPDPEIARAAILALTAWQTPAPLPDLLAVAKGDSNATRQILALRGYIKVISAPSDRSGDDSVALLKQAWQLARQPVEKRAILALLPLCPTPEALRLASAAGTDAAVAREAQTAADTIRGLGVR